MALLARRPSVLVAGDYLSDVEIPIISQGGSLGSYRATLERLAPLVGEAETVVPGHGRPLERDDAQRILEQDTSYLDGLERGDPRLPEGRDSSRQRQIHAENLERCG
jgi:glyoxylase-like metal-dependent hydrolase (beta-lactamase superfamily II)